MGRIKREVNIGMDKSLFAFHALNVPHTELTGYLIPACSVFGPRTSYLFSTSRDN